MSMTFLDIQNGFTIWTRPGSQLSRGHPKLLPEKEGKKFDTEPLVARARQVIGCVSVTGDALPPFVIFNAKQLNPLCTRGEIPCTRYGLSSSGWTDQKLFHGWLKHIPYIGRHCCSHCTITSADRTIPLCKRKKLPEAKRPKPRSLLTLDEDLEGFNQAGGITANAKEHNNVKGQPCLGYPLTL